MKQLDFSVHINAPSAKVWDILWNDATYRKWTSVFSPGSCAESDWKEGSKILFSDGNGGGMSSLIARIVPNEQMSFQHLGIVQDGVEDFTSAQAKGWSGAMENYYLEPKGASTLLRVEVDANDTSKENFENHFQDVFPRALQRVKELAEAEKITPFLWFDGQAEEAARFYTTVFKNSKVGDILRNGETAFVVSFSLDGQTFTALNGGPMFKPNPSVSFFVTCETAAETDAVWNKLAEGGTALMPLDRYAWSERYGWVQDRFGVSWQISLGKLEEVGHQKFVPSLLFTGPQRGRAEEALRHYTSLFEGSSVTGILLYGPNEAGPEGTVKHAQFSLAHQTFMAMDHPLDEPFSFNEAISFVVHCDMQEEVDYFWEKLTADGGEESMCAWLKDKFGVSWQIVPNILPKLLADPDPEKAQHAMTAMLQMRKIVIADLQMANRLAAC